MRRLFLFFVIVLMIATNAVQAQDVNTRFQKQHMKQTEASIVNALNNESAGVQVTAVQTLRQLEWTFPDEEFKSTISPLIRIVKDEKGDTQARILAAIALDGLHSDVGDEAITWTAKSSSNKSVQELCAALILAAQK
jgi:uncharacterized membrane-anchored protein YjiN (DUF445 family)